jgi:predicted O-methyltransferase YrrM
LVTDRLKQITRRPRTLAYRFRLGTAYLGAPLRHFLRWLVRSSETENFTYDLTPGNKRYLASLIAAVTGRTHEAIEGYIRELEEDEDLAEHLRRAAAAHGAAAPGDRTIRNPPAAYGRRIGWYAIARATKPKVIVETGVDKGLGSCILAAALRRNEHEGRAGAYFGTDINPAAGALFGGPYARHGEILYGDSITSLQALDRTIDLLINDSDHSADYEAREYRTVADKLSADAIILGDNSHATPALLEFALSTGRRFVFFQEKPLDHWYPGAGIGIAYRAREGVAPPRVPPAPVGPATTTTARTT